MKKVIDGKLYDTEAENTEEIAYWSSHHNRGDFNYSEETLYVTDKGNYFIYGEGGAMSPYSKPVGNNARGGSSDIRPLSENEAMEWCEKREQTRALMNHFSEHIEAA